MFWDSTEIPWMPQVFKFIGYFLSLVVADLVYRCTFELWHEYKNITLGSTKITGTIWLLLRQKCSKNLQLFYIGCTLVGIISSAELRETISKKTDFWMVFMVMLIGRWLTFKFCQPEDAYSYFISNSGLDCGSFMAYSFFHGYIKYVVPSNSEISSKGLKERIEDYEASQENVNFPLKKLLILQPQSLFIPPKLDNDFLENAQSLEPVEINRGGVVKRSYQISVYKIKGFKGLDWYVTAQGASPLLTYYEECRREKLLDKYKVDVSLSFKERLEKLIREDLTCRGLVEVIYYNDLNEHGEPVDVGLILKNYIEESLKKKAANGTKDY